MGRSTCSCRYGSASQNVGAEDFAHTTIDSEDFNPGKERRRPPVDKLLTMPAGSW